MLFVLLPPLRETNLKILRFLLDLTETTARFVLSFL